MRFGPGNRAGATAVQWERCEGSEGDQNRCCLMQLGREGQPHVGNTHHVAAPNGCIGSSGTELDPLDWIASHICIVYQGPLHDASLM
jgi:hypothetical protein